jgi:hypothetical protein
LRGDNNCPAFRGGVWASVEVCCDIWHYFTETLAIHKKFFWPQHRPNLLNIHEKSLQIANGYADPVAFDSTDGPKLTFLNPASEFIEGYIVGAGLAGRAIAYEHL